MREAFQKQVDLLLRTLPLVAKEESFALKGGTAINFFWRDFPRLSVDMDLTYLPVKDRKESLKEISESVERIGRAIERRIPGSVVTPQKSGSAASKLTIRSEDTQIKLEVNTVLRGSIYPFEVRLLTAALQKEFELFAEIQTLSFEDLYAGKLCAALDRQHPRDLFDVRILLANEGITEKLRKAFIGYLISHSRPINELLNPNAIPIEDLFEKEFDGMTNEPITLDELHQVQRELPKRLLNSLKRNEKQFLLSFKKGNPDWNLITIPQLKELPAVKWKLINIKKMDRQKHKRAIQKLSDVLQL